MPDYSTKDNETLRQTAKLAAVKAAETERAALATASAPEVISPAQDTVKLTDAVSDRLGVPEKAWTGDLAILLKSMDAQNARYQTALDAYRDEVRDLAGKKVEGTGLFQVGYFTHIIIITVTIFAILAIAWLALRIFALFNPPVALGVSAIQGGTRFLSRALSEVIEGGQAFETRIRQRLANQPDLAESILEDFRTAHRAKQSRDVQAVVRRVKS